MRITATIIITLLFISSAAAQQDTGSGMDFLSISPSAFQLSLSEASSATLTGSSAIYSNPALLAMEPMSSVEIDYTLWVAEVNHQFASANFLRENYSLGLGIYNSRSDGFEARDGAGPSQGDFSIGYLSVAGAFAYKIDRFSVGVTAHYLREEVFQYRANGYAVSAGAAAEFFEQRVRLGAVVQNLGEMEELDGISTSLPTTFRLGGMANIVEVNTPGRNDLPILFSLHTEWVHPLEDLPSSDYIDRDGGDDFIAFALSADVADLFNIRGGYKAGPTERPLSFGLGLNIDPVTVNYAVVPFSTGFGWVHSIGVQYYF
ncbi:hypothetical protein DYD21_06585 [Rhodohalobacter sp. SW132]|uniref:PorV/PorQ family protein n=1 Tax=Rhodohalobacter sp. SW132 TaxID=2293433 RepID=UPI000E281CE2|nr:PorV/PorQ family protein [Rhodohalobacter sp. SW132]REL38268.1 hypothetical protein DYD21_06585 [Rhodohalobacter sp. SW132]